MGTIIGIESSCDETSVGVANNEGILSNIITSQIDYHAKHGGVIPEQASRMHLNCIIDVLNQAIKVSNINYKDIDAIAVTSGPGLMGGLLIGSVSAKTLALALGVKFISINHLQAHALVIRSNNKVSFPYLTLLLSGGNTQFVVVKSVMEYDIIGYTRDDAIGETFDKVARMLGFAYPGGKYIEQIAINGSPTRFMMPRPLLHEGGCEMSFSGLKTHINRLISRLTKDKKLSQQDKSDIAASFLASISDVLNIKITKAINVMRNKYNIINEIPVVLSGGVAASSAIRQVVASTCMKNNAFMLAPSLDLCGDNGAMVAWAGVEKYQLGLFDNLDAPVLPRWQLNEIK